GNAAQRGAQLIGGLRAAAEHNDLVGEVRGVGLMVGIELVEPGGRDPSPKAAALLLEETRSRGLLVGKGGLYGNAIRLAPPMTVTSEEVDEAVGIITDALAAVRKELTA
ncbi:MAG TPA: aminotransferase class III-fold pyridoxal phosphate-dependent enzyme, partial [Micromonosporaceae bacterium]|nr:aminotransferase class III-fold pyridoxal phosphate-dependent enzyme [Micromonosporaceae bacterium]